MRVLTGISKKLTFSEKSPVADEDVRSLAMFINVELLRIVMITAENTNPLVDAWLINDRLNRFLLSEVGNDRLSVALAKGKNVASQFAHIHTVRLMWLKPTFPEIAPELQKLEPTAATIEEIFWVYRRVQSQ